MNAIYEPHIVGLNFTFLVLVSNEDCFNHPIFSMLTIENRLKCFLISLRARNITLAPSCSLVSQLWPHLMVICWLRYTVRLAPKPVNVILYVNNYFIFSIISSTTAGSNRVEVSPKLSVCPSAIFRSILRIILPERVLGKPETI